MTASKKRWNPNTGEWVVPGPKMPTIHGPSPVPAREIAEVPQNSPGQRNAAQTRLNALKATQLRAKLLDAIESQIESYIVRAEIEPDEPHDTPMPREAAAKIIGLLKGETLRMLTDAEDRGYGKPTQKQELSHSLSRRIDDDMTPETAAELYQRELLRNR